MSASAAFAELLKQYDRHFKAGQIVKGTILEVRPKEVLVDIGGKSEGVIPAHEFLDIGELQIGSTIEVLVEKLEDKSGAPVLSFDLAEQKKNWDNILTKFPEGSVAAGRVKAKVKGGLIISIGVDAFMPASHIDIQPPKNLDQYVGQTYDFKVLKINVERKNIVLSRRELIEQQRTEKRRALLDSIQPGQVRKGVVKNITEFGLFIGLDGDVDGMVHMSDISWGMSGEDALALHNKGDMVKAVVLDVDVEKERISLGIKQVEKGGAPAAAASSSGLSKGSVTTVTVMAIKDGGLDVQVGDDGAIGFIKRADLGRDRDEQRPDRFQVGQKFDAMITGFDRSKSPTFSIKAMQIAEEKQAVAQYGSSDSGASLGDILGEALNARNTKK